MEAWMFAAIATVAGITTAVVFKIQSRLRLFVWIPLTLGLALLAVAYLASPPTAQRVNDCSHCTQWLGRYWEPTWVFIEAVALMVLWTLGAGVGVAAKWLVTRR
jgi:hypothetical protein